MIHGGFQIETKTTTKTKKHAFIFKTPCDFLESHFAATIFA